MFTARHNAKQEPALTADLILEEQIQIAHKFFPSSSSVSG